MCELVVNKMECSISACRGGARRLYFLYSYGLKRVTPHKLQSVQQLELFSIKLDRSNFLIVCLKVFRLSEAHTLLLSFDHKRTLNMIECLP